MSKIFEAGRFVVQVWPKDHAPVHCHVIVDNGETEIRVFLPDFHIEHKSGKALKSDEIKTIIAIVKDNKGPIGREWRRLHGN